MSLLRPSLKRRDFLAATSCGFAALAAGACTIRESAGAGARALGASADFAGYGPLVPDPQGLLDLPQGFSYKVISKLGDAMDDGLAVPDAADGMGCFDLGGGEIALVRNHELTPDKDGGGDLPSGFDTIDGKRVMPGGTTTMVLDAASLRLKWQYRSLAGTVRNCAGGITPWGSWLTCEEAVFSKSARNRHDHGWVFEVPASASGLVDPVPLTAMGRFNHEAACVDPASGIVYLTEDRKDSVLYRFLPNRPGRLAEGGRLQAMVLIDGPQDTRNWESDECALRRPYRVGWIDLDAVESAEDDLRLRAAAKGAAIIARGEGIWMGNGEMFFCATSGGKAGLGQVFRLGVGVAGADDALELFYESEAADRFNFGDNITVAPNGHLVVCEDQYTKPVNNHLRGLTPDGAVYDLARIRPQAEPAGACFSPDGKVLFFNIYSPAKTLAITGPWIA